MYLVWGADRDRRVVWADTDIYGPALFTGAQDNGSNGSGSSYRLSHWFAKDKEGRLIVLLPVAACLFFVTNTFWFRAPGR